MEDGLGESAYVITCAGNSMTLAAGTKLGRYEIRSKIGEGGMGEVYRATDLKLNRDVAIKVLPGTFLNDAERLVQVSTKDGTNPYGSKRVYEV